MRKFQNPRNVNDCERAHEPSLSREMHGAATPAGRVSQVVFIEGNGGHNWLVQ